MFIAAAEKRLLALSWAEEMERIREDIEEERRSKSSGVGPSAARDSRRGAVRADSRKGISMGAGWVGRMSVGCGNPIVGMSVRTRVEG